MSPDNEITILSKEGCLAYSPVLASYYLGGSIGYQDMFICDESFYRQNRVTLLLGRKVVKVNSLLRKVYTESGEIVEYDDLLIATGSSSILPSFKGVTLPGVFTFYTIEDAKRLNSFLETRENVAVVGAGPIGIQILGALATRGKRLFLVEMMDQVLPEILDRRGARILEERLRQQGVGIHLNETVTRIHEKDTRRIISLSSGNELIADAVILSVGVRPNVDFLQGSGIKVSRGILIDERCRTNIDGVYAAGDVVESPDPVTGYTTMNATWPSAIEQGRVAGLNMADREISILHPLRFNALSVFGYPCLSLGLIREEGKKLEEVSSEDGGGYRKLFFRDRSLVGAVLLGETEGAGIIANLIEKRVTLSDFYEVLLGRGLFAHSVEEYYWSVFAGCKERLSKVR